MKTLKHISEILFVLMFPLLVSAQKPELSGYIKLLNNGTNVNLDNFDDFLWTSWIHQRLNGRWDFHPNATFHLGWRNQFFYGDQVELDPIFAERLEEYQNDILDLSFSFLEGDKHLWNSTIDRLYIEYLIGDLEIAIGRQRINWGINTIWNPNDIFNAYSFVDFDYEERPGSDAFLFRYYLGELSSIEVAGKFSTDKKEMVMAALHKFNTSEYDIQSLVGYANGYWTVGGGWAGNLGNAGWKGEWSWFIDDLGNRENTFLATTGIDYTFGSGWYISGGYLYNHRGLGGASIAALSLFEVSAQNLYPYKHSVIIANLYPATPLLNIGLTTVYSINSSHPVFLIPTIAYSVGQNLDLDFTGQIGLEKGNSYYSPSQSLFLRLKRSF